MTTNQDLAVEERAMVTMSFGDHIEDLRHHLILALTGLLLGIVLTLIPPMNLGQQVMRLMQEPARRTLSRYYSALASKKAEEARLAGSYTSIPARIPAEALSRAIRQVFPELPAPSPGALRGRYVEWPQELEDSRLIKFVDANVERDDALIALGPIEPAVIFCGVTLVTGLVLASPWVFYQIWAFIAAGLYRHERAFVYRFMPYSLGLFLAGVFLCFFAVLPLTLNFLLEFDAWISVKPMLSLGEWMGFATILPLVFGLCFQTPLVMLFLSQIGVFTAAEYRAKRRLAILFIVIAAMLLTPGPDVSSMVFLSIPMILLYELGILLVGKSRTCVSVQSGSA
jgi:sec-independent protein translocase protein TatC